MTMREKIARQIEIAIVERTMHHPVAKQLPKLAWLWPHVADGVLDAMREPTEEMIAAADDLPICDGEGHDLSAVWHTMIDAAKEQGPR